MRHMDPGQPTESESVGTVLARELTGVADPRLAAFLTQAYLTLSGDASPETVDVYRRFGASLQQIAERLETQSKE